MEVSEGRRAAFLGPPRRGKSTLARAALLSYLKREARQRYFGIDTSATHYEGNEQVKGLKEYGFQRVNINVDTILNLKQRFSDPNPDPYELMSLIPWERWVYDDSGSTTQVVKTMFVFDVPDDMRTAAINLLAEQILIAGNAAVLMDEVSMLVNPLQKKLSNLSMLLAAGSNKGIDALTIGQHPNKMNPAFMQNVSSWFVYKVDHKLSYDYLHNHFGEHTPMLRELDMTKRELLVKSPDDRVWKTTANNIIAGLE